MMNKGTAIVGFIICFLAGMALMYGFDHSRKGFDLVAESGATWSDRDSPVPVDSKDPVWGSRSAPVTMVVYSDFQCPFCSRVEGTIDQVKTTYGKDKVRIVWKNSPLPFHQNAKPASEAAQGVYALAGNDAFWKFHDTAFKNQQALSTDSYVKWAKEAGVKDEAKYKQGLEAHTWADKVDKDLAEGKQVGANGTPHFMINGVALSGAQPFDKFKEVIDAQLAKAQAAIASGTKPDKVYVEMSKQNKAATPPPAEAKNEKPEEEDKTVWKVPIGDAPVQGPDTALVTIVEFSDFQCPFCKRVEDTLKKRPRQALRSSAEARRRGPRGRGQGSRSQRRQGEGCDQLPQIQGVHRRRRRPRRQRPGQRHAALLHQRTPPRRRAAVREVPVGHRRGDEKRPGPRRQGSRSEGRLQRDHEKRQRAAAS